MVFIGRIPFLSFILYLLLSGGVAFSQNTSPLEVRELYVGARGQMMGGAIIAVANDETSLLTNPAALGKLRDVFGTLVDPDMEAGANGYALYKAKAYTNPFKLSVAKDVTDATRDAHLYAKGQLFPSFVLRNFGIGLLYSNTMSARMNTEGTEMTTFYREDVAPVVGFNLRFFEGRIKIGANAKLLSRVEVDKVIDPAGSLELSDHAKEGTAFSNDAGIIMTAPVVLLPTISAVARNVGGTRFTGAGFRKVTDQKPDEIKQDVDVALAIFPQHGNRTRSSLTFEYRKMAEAALATDKSRYYHVGYEFNYGDVLFFRAGMNQRYWTAGIELASENTQIMLGSYGEDIGPDGSPEEDRRYIGKFTIRF